MADQSVLQAGNILCFILEAIVIPLYLFTYTSDKAALKADKETKNFTGICERLRRWVGKLRLLIKRMRQKTKWPEGIRLNSLRLIAIALQTMPQNCTVSAPRKMAV